jgi:hypothetical protein
LQIAKAFRQCAHAADAWNFQVVTVTYWMTVTGWLQLMGMVWAAVFSHMHLFRMHL